MKKTISALKVPFKGGENMKKVLVIALLVIGLVALMAAPALADSWWKANNGGVSLNAMFSGLDNGADGIGSTLFTDVSVFGDRGDTTRTDGWSTKNLGNAANVDNGYIDGSPHGGYSTTTNYCKTCHAVHGAGPDSYRLLKSGGATGEPVGATTRSNGEGEVAGAGSARANECMYCHDATSGATIMRPYALGEVATVRGEHTLGATFIPDSTLSVNAAGMIDDNGPRNLADGRSAKLSNRDPNGQDAVLGCYDCHSVHGANTWIAWVPGNIVRLDPGNDGVLGTDSTRENFAKLSDVGLAGAAVADMARNNFCADCHNRNASWDRDFSDTNRTNKASHVTGPAADGQLEVYGTTTTVAWNSGDADEISTLQKRGCRGCHNANDASQVNAASTGMWPHQTTQSKMLETADRDLNYDSEAEGAATDVIGDSYRSIQRLDMFCLKCHDNGTAGDGVGVGESF